MTRQTIEHLSQVEAAICQATRLLALHNYPDDLRTVLVAGIISQALEHHKAMLLLIRGESIGSAFALTRSIVEGMYRGLWINLVASDFAVARFERLDEIGMGMTELARAIDVGYQTDRFFEDLKTRTWDALNSYAHTGMLQLGRRFSEHNLLPRYSDTEIFEVTTTATTCVLILAGRFLAMQNHFGESLATEVLMQTYGARTEKIDGP